MRHQPDVTQTLREPESTSIQLLQLDRNISRRWCNATRTATVEKYVFLFELCKSNLSSYKTEFQHALFVESLNDNLSTIRLSASCLSNFLASWVHVWSEWQSGKKKNPKHLRWASSKGNTAAWLMRALKYWCLALFMALIREKWEKMGHSGSCCPNSFSECLFVHLWIWAEHRQQCSWTCLRVCGGRVRVGFNVRTWKRLAPEGWVTIQTYLGTKAATSILTNHPAPSAPHTPDWDPAPSVCLWYVVYVAGRSSWAEPAIKQPPTTTVILSTLIGAEVVRSHQSTVCLQQSTSRNTDWIKKYYNVVLT